MDYYRAQLFTGLGVLGVYLVLLLGAAVLYIRRANRRWLEAHVDECRHRVEAAPLPPEQLPAPDLGALRSAINGLLDHAEGAPRSEEDRTRAARSASWDWIGSRDIAGWVRLHQAQRLEVWLLGDTEVQERFARAMGQLEELPTLRQSAWLQSWSELQQRPAPDEPAVLTSRRWRSALSQLLAELFNARDATYNQLVGLYGKAGLLVATAYLPVTALLVAGYGPVLLAGFIGGLLSRLQRLVYGQDLPTSYGTSWVTLFLAPLLGALAAWTGLHLVGLLQAFGIVAGTQQLTGYRLQVSPAVLGLAVLFGFSERLLNQVGSQAERVIAGDRAPGAAVVAGPNPVSAPAGPARGGPGGPVVGVGSSPGGGGGAARTSDDGRVTSFPSDA